MLGTPDGNLFEQYVEYLGALFRGDFGISYPRADAILHWILLGYRSPEIVPLGFTEEEIALVRRRLDSTHWKRRLPTPSQSVSQATASGLPLFFAGSIPPDDTGPAVGCPVTGTAHPVSPTSATATTHRFTGDLYPVITR